ncbi:MAG: hypothetical protein WBB28_13145 [Crinalium sp.]
MSFQSIRRAVIASGLVIGAAAAFSPAAFADTSGSVNVSGTVTSTLAVTAAASGSAANLDLDGDGTFAEHIVPVGDITMLTNNEQGLTLTVEPGSLTKTGGTAIPFQVTTVDDGTGAPTAGVFASGNHTVATSAAGTDEKDLYIKYTPAALQDPGTYNATIAVSVVDNN